MKKTFLILALLCAIAQGAWGQAATYWTDEGKYSTSWTHTEDGGKTIYIDSEADLARLAFLLMDLDSPDYNYGYQGYTFKLTKDLDLGAHQWTPMGDIEYYDNGEDLHPFRGVFDGQGHTISGIYVEDERMNDGLFGYVEGDSDHKAIITNLKLINSRIAGDGYCGGIAGFISGNVEVSNIVCEAVTVLGDESVGGIIGQANEGPTVKNCFYKGNGVSGNSGVGAIIGGGGAADYEENYTTYWVNNHETRVSPITLNLPEGVEMNWWSTPIKYLDGGYYLPDDAAMVMGPYCRSADGSLPTNRITGLSINGVALTLGFDGIYRHTFNQVTESGKTIAVTAEHLSVTGNGTSGNPYRIYNATDWNAFANAVTNGGNSFAGKFFRLENNLTVPTMVGAEGNPFSGTFKAGTNQTIYNYLTFNCGTEASPYTEDYCAPFRYIDGATIENLKVVGNVYTSGKYAGGIVAVADGENSHITGCHSSVIIKSIFDASAQERYNAYHGGFVALVNKYLTITGSLFDGAIIADNDEYGKNTLSECGGFVGALGELGYSHITGCLVDAEHEQMYNYGYTFVNHDEGNLRFMIENSYYTHPIAYSQGSYAYKVTSQQPANTVGDTYKEYPVSGFGVGDHGLRFTKNSIHAWYVASIGLYDNDDNTDLLNEFIFDTQSSGYVSITLSKRTLFKDGSWNTLCLPFDVSAQQIAENALAGAMLMKLKDSSFDNTTGKLTINFETVTSIESGKPYIVRWEPLSGNIVDPVFEVVAIVNTEPEDVATDYIDFIGTFSPEVIYETGDKTKLYLGSDDTFYYPTSSGYKVNSFRGYFQLKNGLTASTNPSQAGANSVKEFMLNFGDDDVTGITETERDSSLFNLHPAYRDGWYTLDGRKLSDQPTQKGIYINNGQKVVIK